MTGLDYSCCILAIASLAADLQQVRLHSEKRQGHSAAKGQPAALLPGMRCNLTRGLHAELEVALAALQRAPAMPEKKQSKAPKRWWMLPNFIWESMLQMGIQKRIGGTAYHHTIKIPPKMRRVEWRLRRYGLVNDRPVGQPFLEQKLCSSGMALCFRTGLPFGDCPCLRACSLGRDS